MRMAETNKTEWLPLGRATKLFEYLSDCNLWKNVESWNILRALIWEYKKAKRDAHTCMHIPKSPHKNVLLLFIPYNNPNINPTMSGYQNLNYLLIYFLGYEQYIKI